MGRVHDPLPAHGFVLLSFIIHSDSMGFVVAEQEHICPFFYKRGDLGLCFLSQLQLPSVVCPHFVRLFEFPQLGMGSQHDVDTCFNNICQAVQEPSELFFGVNISVPISEVFNPGLIMLCTDMFHAELLSPVNCVDH